MFHSVSHSYDRVYKVSNGGLSANAVLNFGLKFVHTLFFKEADQFVMEEAVKSLEKSTVTH